MIAAYILLLPFLAWCFALRAITGSRLTPGTIALLIIFPTAIAYSLCAMFCFAASEVLGTFSTGTVVFSIMASALIGIAARHVLFQHRVLADSKANRALLWGCAVVFLIPSILTVIGVFLDHTKAFPLGQWDAWAMWNMKSRWIVRGGPSWDKFISPDLSSRPDYPLMTPLLIAGGWKILGVEAFLIPVLLAGISTIGILLIPTALGQVISAPFIGILGTVVLCGGSLAYFGSFQQADIPFAFLSLSSLAAVVIGDFRERIWLLIGGFLAGAALFTKNEGVPLFAFELFALALVQFFLKIRGRYFDFALGAVPLLICRLVMLLKYRVSNDLLASADRSGVDWSRCSIVLRAFGKELFVGNFFVLSLLLPAVLFGVWLADRRTRFMFAFLSGALLCQLTAYIGSYLVSPYDLNWHIQSSINRLGFHLYLIGVLAALLGLRSIEGRRAD